MVLRESLAGNLRALKILHPRRFIIHPLSFSLSLPPFVRPSLALMSIKRQLLIVLPAGVLCYFLRSLVYLVIADCGQRGKFVCFPPHTVCLSICLGRALKLFRLLIRFLTFRYKNAPSSHQEVRGNGVHRGNRKKGPTRGSSVSTKQ